jgi:hypothetical protein
MTMFRKALTATAVAIVLASVPSHLAAQEREAPGEARATLGWFSGLWNELAALFAGQWVPPPTGGSGGGATTQGSCAVDPNGCTQGG